MPRMMEMDVKPPLIIDLEEIETSKEDSPNSTLSSSNAKRLGGGLRGDKYVISDDEEGGSGGGDGGGEEGERKKLRLSKEQTLVLEQAFREHTTLNTKQKVTLARQVNLRPRQVEVWFQNRRARTKLKQTEVDCEYLRKFCETLTEQNRKLQKEVHELRALKNRPSTALNKCPSCKTVSHPSTSTAVSGVLHRPVPVNLKKLSLTINNNMMLKSHLPHG
ncbi:homeobox-leucine zipper protein HAT4-like [Silene latifolia]|uniref:homeobox-leucine zipper protein HAT4-like n=1 Tax=Silene latifolia TaxID=37657 RepID=UPI003D76E475